MVVEQLVLRGNRRRAGVEQGKAAGAVGRLHHARREAGLTDGGGLLVAGDAGDRDSSRRTVRARLAPNWCEESFTSGSIERGTRRIFRSSSSHCAGVDVEQQRARGVGGVGRVHLAAGQPPQQIAIDGAEHQLAALGPRPRAGDVVEDPGHFGAGEIGIDDQAGLGRDRGLVAFALQFGADVGGAAVLPDDGAMHGLAGGAVPHHGGLALVGDADGGDVFGRDASFLQRLAADGDGRGPDVLRLVLDPARGRKMLREFSLRRRGDGNVAAKDNGARGCGALIDGQHKGHDVASREVGWVVLCQGKRIGARRSIWRTA